MEKKKNIVSSVKHDGVMLCAPASRTGSLVFIDNASANRIISEVYRAILSTQIQPNAAKLTDSASQYK